LPGGDPPGDAPPGAWACAENVNAVTVSSETNGRTLLGRLDALIRKTPFLAVPAALIDRATAPERSNPIFAPDDDAANIADGLVAPCLVTNP
jgi:hypothetical protein